MTQPDAPTTNIWARSATWSRRRKSSTALSLAAARDRKLAARRARRPLFTVGDEQPRDIRIGRSWMADGVRGEEFPGPSGSGREPTPGS